MVVCDFHLIGVSILPDETKAPLIIYSDAVLSGPIALKFFQAICRRDSEVIECLRIVEHTQLAQCRLLDITGEFSR